MSRLTEDDIQQALRERSAWTYDGTQLVRDAKFPDFAAAMAFANAVAEVAEERGHHPDILVHGWNNVRLLVSSHAEGGVTDACLGLADAVDAIS